MNTPEKEERIDILERALVRAHEAQETPQFSRDWTADVMRDVRRQASQEPSLSEVPRMIWRAAAVVAIVSTLILGSVLAWTAGQGDADFTALLTMATADSMLSTGEP
jgi:hypothetical protein